MTDLHVIKPELRPFTLSIPVALEVVVIGDQLTSLEAAPFYNSNCSKPNGSASPFGEAQLDNTRLRSAEMARGSHSRRNVPPSMVSPSEPEQPASPEEETPAPSDVGLPDAPVPAPTPARYTKEDLQRITKC